MADSGGLRFEGVRALLFDFDGTLIEPSIDFGRMREVVLAVVSDYGGDPSGIEHLPVLEIIAQVRPQLEGRDGERANAFAEAAQQAILDIELDAADRVQAYRGVPRMLDRLAARGYGLGIVTRNSRVAVERVLRRIPMSYDVLLTRDDVAQVKPDPRHLSAALEVLGVPAHEAVMCGDHPMDITAGKSVGARTVGVLRPGAKADHFSVVCPDLILSRVTDLLRHVT